MKYRILLIFTALLLINGHAQKLFPEKEEIEKAKNALASSITFFQLQL